MTGYITRSVSYFGNSGARDVRCLGSYRVLTDRCARQRHSIAIDVYSMFDHESKYSKQASKLSYNRHYHASFEVCSRPR